jgi:predicted RNA-binding protein with PUA-like domain
MKSEPEKYSIDQLAKDGFTHWDGVRNYQARNTMRDDMKIGDKVLFYHSNAKPPGVVGTATICKESYPDFTAWDPKDPHFDPKTDSENPRWMMVDIAYESKFMRLVDLPALKANLALEGMLVIRRGQRLSVQPVEKAHFDEVIKMGN